MTLLVNGFFSTLALPNPPALCAAPFPKGDFEVLSFDKEGRRGLRQQYHDRPKPNQQAISSRDSTFPVEV